RRLLRPSGYAILALPRLDGLLTILMLAVGLQPPSIECSLRRRYGAPGSSPRVSGHVSHFTRPAVNALVPSHGFTAGGFNEASIYNAWRYSGEGTPALSRRVPLWLISKIPFKQDELIVRIVPASGPSSAAAAPSVW